MVESCKRTMPHVSVIQLTGAKTHRIDGADGVIRLRANDPYLMPFKLKHLAALPPPFLFLDSDMLVTESLVDVFDSEFDVAMCRRDTSRMVIGDDILEMPYNAGFIACRTPGFFDEAYRVCEKQAERWKTWFGDQLAIGEIAHGGKYRILDLPRMWNHAVEGPDDLRAKVLHYKGEKRKAWMPQAANLLRTACVM